MHIVTEDRGVGGSICSPAVDVSIKEQSSPTPIQFRARLRSSGTCLSSCRRSAVQRDWPAGEAQRLPPDMRRDIGKVVLAYRRMRPFAAG